MCVRRGEGAPERPPGCEKVGECVRAPGLAAGAAAAEKGGGSRHPDPLPPGLLLPLAARPAALLRRRRAREAPPEPEFTEGNNPRKEGQADQDV